jgi:hypothetical protein
MAIIGKWLGGRDSRTLFSRTSMESSVSRLRRPEGRIYGFAVGRQGLRVFAPIGGCYESNDTRNDTQRGRLRDFQTYAASESIQSIYNIKAFPSDGDAFSATRFLDVCARGYRVSPT